MFERITTGGGLIRKAIQIFIERPTLLLPLLVSWIFYATVAVYLEFYFPWKQFTFRQQLGFGFLTILYFALLLSFSCLVLLELIQQLHKGRPLRFCAAVGEAFSRDLLKAFPIVFVWAMIWFVLALLQALISRRRKDDDDNQPTPEAIARTLAGVEPFSWKSLSFDLIKKALRMLVFLILPAIAWEDQSTRQAVKKGFQMLRTHLSEFVTGFVVTELASCLIFLPCAILFYVWAKGHFHFPDWVWFTTWVYCAFAWSASIFLEQMFAAELYCWHMEWEQHRALALQNNRPARPMRALPVPAVLSATPWMRGKNPGFL